MKKLQVILLIMLIVTSLTPLTLVSAQPYTYKEVQLGDYTYDYYFTGKTDWVMLFIPGGIGYQYMIDGCLGKFDKKNICVVNPRADEWLARLYIDNKIDFIEPQKYIYNLASTWVMLMLSHLKTDLKYENILLAGFSGGGSVVASMPTVYSNLQNIVNSCVVYEGPTISYASGPMGSASRAHSSLTKTFLAYGTNDTTAGPENGSRYANVMLPSVPKMLVTVPIGHDLTIAVHTLDSLFTFIGKPRPPKYIVETQTISYTTENTVTSMMTETSTETATITGTVTTTLQTTTTFQTKIIKSYAPSWETIRNAIILTGWFAGLILCIWFIRNRKKSEAWFSKVLNKYEIRIVKKSENSKSQPR